MKSINFKRQESVIRGFETTTEKKPKKPRNWDRIIYIILLFIVLFFVGRYLVNNLLYVEAPGEVLFDSIKIQNTDDCRLVKFYVQEGESVCIGDTLFSYFPDKPEGAFNAYGVYQFGLNQKEVKDVSWAEKEIFKTQEKIKLNKNEINKKTKMRDVLKSSLERIRQEVMLDVMPRRTYDKQVEQINEINYEIEALKKENKLLQASLGRLAGMKRDLGEVTKVDANGDGVINANDGNESYVFFSPVEGTVTNIYKNRYEVALKEEVIMSIHKPENIYIKGFFAQEDVGDIKAGDVVEIEFPNGDIAQGYIKRLSFTTYELPEEFQKKYEPTTRALTVDIYPTSYKELSNWKMFWKMGVTIRKYRY